MKLSPWTSLFLLLPLAALGAEPSRQDFARATKLVPDASRGAVLFAQCTSCHGADGGGVVAGTMPRIAGQHYRVLVKQLVDFRRGKRWDFQMEPVAKRHGAIPELQDIVDVAWHVSQLDRDGTRGVGNGDHVARGEEIYTSKCAACHGRGAEGEDAREIPRLAGQHAAYLMRQIYDAVDGRRPPLTRTHRERFAPLAFEEVLGLSDYISRLGWKAGPAGGTSAH